MFDTLNSIIDALIIYTEFMAFYGFIVAMTLHINKWLSKKLSLPQASAAQRLLPRAKEHVSEESIVKGLMRKHSNECETLYNGHEHVTLAGASNIEASERQLDHTITPFRSTTFPSYWKSWTCVRLRNYLQDLGYTRTKRLRKTELIQLAMEVTA